MTDSVFIKNVIDHFYNLEPVAGLDDRIKVCLESISNNYLNGNNSPALDLSSSTARLAYLFQYVSAHSRHLARVLAEARQVNGGPLFAPGELKVACLGGGPGTDAIGVLKYIQAQPDEPQIQNLHCCVLDNQPRWADNWQTIGQMLGAPVVPHFAVTDATVPMCPNAQGYISTADVITISYLVSAVEKFNANNGVTSYFHGVFNQAKPGALIVYVDNIGGHTDYFDAMCAGQPLTLVRSWDYQGGPKWGSFQQDLTPLDVYKTKFGRDIKIAAKLSYRVLRKT